MIVSSTTSITVFSIPELPCRPWAVATLRANRRGMGCRLVSASMIGSNITGRSKDRNTWKPLRRSERLMTFQSPKRLCSPLILSNAMSVNRRTVWDGGIVAVRRDDRLQNLNNTGGPKSCTLRNQAGAAVEQRHLRSLMSRPFHVFDPVHVARYGCRHEAGHDKSIKLHSRSKCAPRRLVACATEPKTWPAPPCPSQREARRGAAMAPRGFGMIWTQATTSVD